MSVNVMQVITELFVAVEQVLEVEVGRLDVVLVVRRGQLEMFTLAVLEVIQFAVDLNFHASCWFENI